MSDTEFINQLLNNVLNPAPADELSEKLESIAILNLLNKPESILGCDEYQGYEIEFINYDFKYFSLLFNSSLFIEFMFRCKNRLNFIFTICQLDKLRYLLEMIYYREDISEELREKVLQAESKIEEILKEAERLIVLDIEKDILGFLWRHPNSFFKYLREIDSIYYFGLIMHNDFTDTVADLINAGFKFSEEQIGAIQKILGTSIKLYHQKMNGFTDEDNSDDYLSEHLEHYVDEEKYTDFEFDICLKTYEKLDDLLDERNTLKKHM